MSNIEMFWILAIYLVVFTLLISWAVTKFIMDTEELQNIRKRAKKKMQREN